MSLAVFLDPVSNHFEEDRLFGGTWPGHHSGPYLHVRDVFAERGVPVHTADRLFRGQSPGERNAYFALGNVRNYRKLAGRDDVVLSGLFHVEAPILSPTTYSQTPEASRYFERVYSFSNAEALAPFGCAGVPLRHFLIPEPYEGIDGFEGLWARRDRNFLCMISQNKLPTLQVSELYTERLRLLEHFSRSDSIDLYGVGWDRMPFRVGERRTPQQLVRVYRIVREHVPFMRNHPYEDLIRRVYRGAVESKAETMSRYTFAITYENMVLDGWINEKIFDAFVVGTIPIYLGAPDVTEYIPEDCFIDPRRFSDYFGLEAFLRSLGPREIATYRENAKDFLASERFRPFSKAAFADIFLGAVEDDFGVSLRS